MHNSAAEVAGVGDLQQPVRRRLVQSTLFPHRSQDNATEKEDKKGDQKPNEEEEEEEYCASQGKKKRQRKPRAPKKVAVNGKQIPSKKVDDKDCPAIESVERGFKGNSYPRLVKMVLSATITQDPCKLAQLNLHHHLSLTTGQRRYQLPEQLESFKLICESKHKPLYLVALLQTLQEEKCIVFTSSVESTHRLCTLLNFFGDLQIKIKEYSGLQRQFVRSKTLRAFREGEIQVLVSSDAMTRGMDVEGLRNVINYDVPAYIKTYIHRAGRTTRAGQAGRCFTLLRKDEVKRFKKLLQKADNNYCSVYSVPSDSIESFRSTYTSDTGWWCHNGVEDTGWRCQTDAEDSLWGHVGPL
ncbi:hypothetical protein TEA_026169 [Camellia sinensis var. sinensis]|uniref:Helicase C-terminal domain-containing protein n=1 Tax=Camellia sinensis var. sinensis TaxID=542762 RepID=A0A4S4D403_CAMSN|nr:hypothetical protein TEA_026169 [Camellia sinensis var. sinensis]